MPHPRSPSRSRRRSASLAIVALCAAVTSCAAIASSHGQGPPVGAASQGRPGGPKVLIIGVDGLRGDALATAEAPTFQRLMDEGAYSTAALAGDVTLSGPGWSSILTGVWRADHGVRNNAFAAHHLAAWPDVFARHRAANPAAYGVSIAVWALLNRHIVRGADRALTIDAGCQHAARDCGILAVASRILATDSPDITAIIWDEVDEAGHDFGFTSPQYRAAIGKVDREVAALLAVVEGRASFADERWLVVVASDHGGHGRVHGDDIPEDRETFLLVHGPGVKAGRIEPAPTQVDVVPTVLTWLGSEVDPSWRLAGRSVALDTETPVAASGPPTP